MRDDEIENTIRLIQTPHIGPITFTLLLARYQTATQAVKAAPALAERRGRKLHIASKDIAQKIIADADKAQARILIKGGQDYPATLTHFDDAPAVLFAKGHISLLQKDLLAVVGARNASTNAMKLTSHWTKSLGEAGFGIVSGLARGIDRAAHIGSLATGTIGVIGCGIDIIYPQDNADLYHEMAQSGLILAEMVPGTKPSPRNFPARNRIIASLAKGVIVTEAAINSGSLITAREAIERGAEIMAIPGAPTEQRAYGANHLIKDGAHLVTSPQDVIDIMHSAIKEPTLFPPSLQNENLDDIDEEMVTALSDAVMKILTFEATDIDELTRQCHVSAKAMQIALLDLELAGEVQRLSGNRICKLLKIE